MTIREAIARLVEGRNLSEEEMASVMTTVMSGETTPAQIGGFLALLRRKGETVEEITGAARVMRERVTRIRTTRVPLVDTCGTGGDASGTFNISTATALVVAAAGGAAAKHGNRALSGVVGGADVLEELGVRIDLAPESVERVLENTGFGFLFAPLLHGAMKHAAGPRKELGVRTIFNLLGPLTNPAGALHQLLGVFDEQWVEPLARVLGRLGSIHALVVHGSDGLDEITLTGPTRVAEWRNGEVSAWTLRPEDYGLRTCLPEALRIRDAAESAARVRSALAGEAGPATDVVLLNAAAAVYAADLASSIAEGLERARDTITSGRATELLQRVIRETHA